MRIALFKRMNESWRWGYKGTLRAVLKRDAKKEVERELREIEEYKRRRDWDD